MVYYFYIFHKIPFFENLTNLIPKKKKTISLKNYQEVN